MTLDLHKAKHSGTEWDINTLNMAYMSKPPFLEQCVHKVFTVWALLSTHAWYQFELCVVHQHIWGNTQVWVPLSEISRLWGFHTLTSGGLKQLLTPKKSKGYWPQWTKHRSSPYYIQDQSKILFLSFHCLQNRHHESVANVTTQMTTKIVITIKTKVTTMMQHDATNCFTYYIHLRNQQLSVSIKIDVCYTQLQIALNR